MTYHASRLPGRFPVGTKLVVEGQPAREGRVQVVSRYLEFPDGRFFPLSPQAPRKLAGKMRQRTRMRKVRRLRTK